MRGTGRAILQLSLDDGNKSTVRVLDLRDCVENAMCCQVLQPERPRVSGSASVLMQCIRFCMYQVECQVLHVSGSASLSGVSKPMPA